MNIKIGAKIRNLRIGANITQEKLANHLGVSVQAVSRWESEICYPDLELIPAIAKYFGVTTDHILCIEQETVQPIEDKFKEEWKNAFKSGYTQKALEIINEALLTNPNNFEFMLMKAETLICFYEHSCNKTRISESDRLLRSILELLNLITSECKNESIRCKARVLKIGLDAKLNNQNSFIRSAKNLPDLSSTKNRVLANYYCWGDNEKAGFTRKYILELLIEFVKSALILAENSTIADGEKTAILENTLTVISSTVGNLNCGEFEQYLELIYENLYNLTGNSNYKDEIGSHIKSYDSINDCYTYNSAFVKDVRFNKNDFKYQY